MQRRRGKGEKIKRKRLRLEDRGKEAKYTWWGQRRGSEWVD